MCSLTILPDESGGVPLCSESACEYWRQYRDSNGSWCVCQADENQVAHDDEICLPRVRLYKAEINELKEKQARLEAALDRARKMAQYASSPNEAIIYTPAFEWNELVELIDRAMGNV